MSRSGRLKDLVKHTVVVHLKSGTQSFRGVLWNDIDDENPAPHLVLIDASVIEPEGAIRLDGDVWIPTANVDFFQIVKPTE
jgi:small nuclear ribonucleoprotein (snRNP)-like protein